MLPLSLLEVGIAVTGAVSVAANTQQLLMGEPFAWHQPGLGTFKVSLQDCVKEQVTELSCYKYLNSSLLIFVALNMD